MRRREGAVATTKQSPLARLGNWFIAQVLRSPLHGLLSNSVMLIGVTGRKTGKHYVTPVNYLRDGDDLLVISFRSRSWWRNARDCAVTLRLRGADKTGYARVIEDEAEVAAELISYLKRALTVVRRMLSVRTNEQGDPFAEDIAQAAQDRVIVRVRL